MFFALPSIFEAGASRLPRLANVGSLRNMSSVHLGNLSPAKGSTKTVRVLKSYRLACQDAGWA